MSRIVVASMMLLAGCSGHTDKVAKLSAAPATRDAAADDPAPSRTAFCVSARPKLVAANSGERCLGQLASQLFSYAACSCTTLSALGAFRTDRFDSSSGPYTPTIPPTTGAAIGINGSFVGGGLYYIGGSLTVGGGFAAPAMVTVSGDLRVGGPILLAGGVEVTGSAWLADSVMAAGGWLLVHGDLRQAVGTERNVTADTLMVQGQDLREQITSTVPCACGADEILDVAGIVDHAKTHNHNADAAFDADSLSSATGDARIDLPCGELWAAGLEARDRTHLVLALDSVSSLFIDGDLTVKGSLTFELGDAADVDVFVSGNYLISGTQDFKTTGAGTIRFYVAGDQRIELSEAFVGSLYAPRADVTLSGSSEVYGAIFAKSLTAPGSVAVHYDRRVARAGDGCEQ